MRWTRLFDDLDAQAEAAERAERAAETADLRRLETSRLTLADRLAAAGAVRLGLTVEGAGLVTGELSRAGADWALLDTAGAECLVSLAAVVAVVGLPATSARPLDEVDRRVGMGTGLRQLSRDRAVVTIVTRGGATFTGTIDRVGADFVDVAEHAPDVARRAADVQRVRTVAGAAIALVRPA
ncbi:MAG TPA: hypothetical protein VFH66_09360 [Mycobacteriales bacterium]|nr:hypothetical protein [Mycobacteriales bacterium]